MRCEAEETQRTRSDKEEVPANGQMRHVGVAAQKQTLLQDYNDHGTLPDNCQRYCHLPTILEFIVFTQEITLQESRSLNTGWQL